MAAGLQAAGETDGAGGVLGLGIAAGSVGVSSLMQPAPLSALPEPQTQQGEPDLVATLESLKRALDAGLINQADYDAAKAKALGLS